MRELNGGLPLVQAECSQKHRESRQILLPESMVQQHLELRLSI